MNERTGAVPEEFTIPEPAAEIDAGSTLLFTVGGRTYEVPATCPHRGAPLREAVQTGPFLRCAWHGATFDIRTGRLVRGPQCPDLQSVDVTDSLSVAKELASWRS